MTPEREKELRYIHSTWAESSFASKGQIADSKAILEVFAALDEARKETEKWKQEYRDLCEFANAYEKERDELKAKFEGLKSELEGQRKNYERRINQLKAERDKFEELAQSWMHDYDKLKEKYEPSVAVLSADNGRTAPKTFADVALERYNKSCDLGLAASRQAFLRKQIDSANDVPELARRLKEAIAALKTAGNTCGIARTFLEFHGRPSDALKNCKGMMKVHEKRALEIAEALERLPEGEK